MSIITGSPTSVSGITLVTTLISIYIISQFLRSSIGVIAPNLAEELELSAGEVGLLSSVYFFTFAAVQIPLGMALDRFGPRLCLVALAVVTVLGALVFALAPNPTVLILGRALLGIGTSGSLVASLAVYARRFPPHRFATVIGLQLGVGTLGTLIATAPLAFSTATIGWRNSFIVVAAITFVIGCVIAVVVKDHGRPACPRGERWRENLAGIAAVMRTPSVGRLFALNLVNYSAFALIVGLWGGPYLTHVYGFSLEQRGNFLLIPVITQIIGSMVWGGADRLVGSYRLPVLVGAGFTAAALLVVAAWGTLPPAILVVWFAAFGFVAAYGPVLIAHGMALFPAHQLGRGLTILNMGSMGGTFLAQAVSGFVIELFPTTPDGGYALAGYRLVFALQAIFILLACLVYLGSRDPRPQTKAAPIA